MGPGILLPVWFNQGDFFFCNYCCCYYGGTIFNFLKIALTSACSPPRACLPGPSLLSWTPGPPDPGVGNAQHVPGCFVTPASSTRGRGGAAVPGSRGEDNLCGPGSPTPPSSIQPREERHPGRPEPRRPQSAQSDARCLKRTWLGLPQVADQLTSPPRSLGVTSSAAPS